MIDYIESRIARQEYEQRVRSLTPVRDHDVRLKDDRQLSIYPILSGIDGIVPDQPGWVSKQTRRWLLIMGNGLRSLGEQTKRKQDGVLAVSLKDHKDNIIPG